MNKGSDIVDIWGKPSNVEVDLDYEGVLSIETVDQVLVLSNSEARKLYHLMLIEFACN